MTNQPQSQLWRDANGREWIARLDIGAAEDLKGRGLDILDPHALGDAIADPIKALEIMAAAHRKQCAERNLEIGDFVEVATETEQVALAAAVALEAALADFFRRLRRPALAGVVATATKAAEAATELALAKLADPRVEQAMRAALERAGADVDAAIEAAITGRKSGD